MPPIFISIDGNIGAGKTTVCKAIIDDIKLKIFEKPNIIKVLLEPLERYETFERGPLKFNPLKCMYEDPKHETCLAQLHFMRESQSRFSQSLVDDFPKTALLETPIVLTERCFLSTLAFLNTYKSMGLISSFSHSFLLEEFIQLAQLSFIPDIIQVFRVEICQHDTVKDIVSKVEYAIRSAYLKIKSKMFRQFNTGADDFIRSLKGAEYQKVKIGEDELLLFMVW